MNYRLNTNGDGKVRYMMRKPGGVPVGSDTSAASASWLLNEGKPYRSDEMPGYPVAVEVRGAVYFFDGVWEKPGLFDDAPRSRRRRVKDSVCE